MTRNLIILPMVSIIWAFSPPNPHILPTEYERSATITGFPVPYWSDAPIISLTFDTYVVALAINLACYTFVAVGLLWLWRAIPIFRNRWLNLSAAWILSIVGALLVLPFLIITATGDNDLVLWYDDVTWDALRERYF